MAMDDPRIARLEERLHRLAQQKARLEMVALLYERLADVEGLDTTLDAILATVMDIFGGTDIIIYCRIAGQWHKRTVGGERSVLEQLDDPEVARVIETGVSDVQVATPVRILERDTTLEARHRIIPLVDRGQPFGAVKVTGLILFDDITHQLFETFFHFASILLSREVSGESRYRDLFDQLEESVAVLEEIQDPTGEIVDYRVLDVNASMARMLGGAPQAFTGKRTSELAAAGLGMSCAEIQSFLTEAEQSRGYEQQVPGTSRWFGTSVYRSESGRISVLLREVTERRRMDEELAKLQKLESLSVLSAGIAHDFNNLLQGLFGMFDLACAEAAPGSKVARTLSSAGELFDRAKDLTRQLLTFAKGGAPVRVVADIEPTVRQALSLASHGTAMSVALGVDPELARCEVDVGQLSQVMQNLAINANQAMAGGGELSVTLRNQVVDETLGASLDIEAGDYVRIDVKDSGCGIPAELLPRVFDPFFTTKASGTGLGLASCFSIVRRHGGHISVRSTVGEGTEFSVLLPATNDAALPPRHSSRPAPDKLGARILVMDDEATVRELTVAMLERLGYIAVAAADGEQALVAFREALTSDQPFCAVILDVTVRGGMGGIETFERLRALCPDVRAIVSSGYSESVVFDEAQAAGWRGVLPKPFRRSELERVLAQALR